MAPKAKMMKQTAPEKKQPMVNKKNVPPPVESSESEAESELEVNNQPFDENPFGNSDSEDERNSMDAESLADDDEMDMDDFDMDGEDFDMDGSEQESDVDSSDEKTDFTNMEKQSKKILKAQKQEEQEAADELQLNVSKSGEIMQYLQSSAEHAPLTDLSKVKQRISDIILLLENYTKEFSNMTSRTDLLTELVAHTSMYYGYNEELCQYFMKLLSPAEAISLFESNEIARPVTIRANTLKIKRKDLAAQLISRGMNVDVLGDWTKEGLKVISSSIPVGATPEYLSGKYIIQSASSLVPVLALKPLPNERILDVSAAPGGKSTHIGQLMQNKGILYVNDFKKARCSSLIGNIHRLGITNSVVINTDGRKLPANLTKLDKVLLDAPCSGLGIIARDPSIKLKRGLKDFEEHAVLQKELLAAAIDMVDANSKTGGIVVYSTCSLAVEENEAVVDHILKVRNVKIVPLGVDIGDEGVTKFKEQRFDNSLKLSRRFYPHKHNMDGFFVCKLQKTSNEIPERAKKDRRKVSAPVWTEEQMKDAANDFLTFDEEVQDEKKEKQEKKNTQPQGAIKLSTKNIKKETKKIIKNQNNKPLSNDPTKRNLSQTNTVTRGAPKEGIATPQIFGKKMKKRQPSQPLHQNKNKKQKRDFKQ